MTADAHDLAVSGDDLKLHAEKYAAGGQLIFPADPKNKEPRGGVSQYRATSDVAIVSRWWSQWPDSLIGCRPKPDELILDIDPRHGGDKTWDALEDEYGPIRVNRMHHSGRGDGGFHAWFQRPDWLSGVSRKRLDAWAEEHEVGEAILKDGEPWRWTSGMDPLHHTWRYTILPPSPHPTTGEPYRWREHNTALGPLLIPIAELLLPKVGAGDQDHDEQNEHVGEHSPSVSLHDLEHTDSIADWFTETSTWTEILAPHGWTLAHGDGDGDGSLWRHPNADPAHEHSASVRHGCLFVYSPNTVFEPTEGADPQGYTRFRAWALLKHCGDGKAAARAARKRKTGSRVTVTTPSPSIVDCPRNLPDEFWNARPWLTELRTWAHSRGVSADAVYASVRARFTALIPPTLTIDTGLAVPISFNSLIGLVADSGGSKTVSMALARELVPLDLAKHVFEGGLGSGEGLIEAYFEMQDRAANGKTTQAKVRTKDAVLLLLDEGESMSRIGERSGATLGPNLRSAYSAAPLGNANASKERRRQLAPGSYRFVLLAAVQPTVGAAILADAGTGTPQRFVWYRTSDPAIPDAPAAVARPNAPRTPPTVRSGQCMTVADSVRDEIRQRFLRRARGGTIGSDLDSRRDENRITEAAVLALLDGTRFTVTDDDWQLAGMVLDVSDQVRREMQAHKAEADEHNNVARGVAQGAREAVAETERERRLVAALSQRLVARVPPEGIGKGQLSRLLTKKTTRHRFEPALDLAVRNLGVEVVEVDGGERVRRRSP